MYATVGETEKIAIIGNVDTINSKRYVGTVSLMLFFDSSTPKEALAFLEGASVRKIAKVEPKRIVGLRFSFGLLRGKILFERR